MPAHSKQVLYKIKTRLPAFCLQIKFNLAFSKVVHCMTVTMQPSTQRLGIVALFIVVMQLASCSHNLEEEYRFSAILDDGYTLHWNFDMEQQTIAFAVNVSTTGWVGFGLSPNGQMPQSDVVIGWVDNDGNTQFHVSLIHLSLRSPRYAHSGLLGITVAWISRVEWPQRGEFDSIAIGQNWIPGMSRSHSTQF